MAEFDTISKHLIQKYPHDFAGFTLGREDVEVLAVIDTEQYTVEARQTDSLIRVRIDDEEVLVHNEFQTTDSTNPPMPRLPGRLPAPSLRQAARQAAIQVSNLDEFERMLDSTT